MQGLGNRLSSIGKQSMGTFPMPWQLQIMLVGWEGNAGTKFFKKEQATGGAGLALHICWACRACTCLEIFTT